MKTISEQVQERQKERRKDARARAAGVVLVACLLVIAALVIGAAFLKTARIVAEAQASAFCEGELCADPAW